MIRIKGLVRSFNAVRSELQVGIPEGEIDAFRNRVKGTVRQVEQLCRRDGTEPDQLPGPSRNAYRFLKDLDLNDLPLRPDRAPAPASHVIRLKNVAIVELQLGQRMWGQLPSLIESARLQSELQEDIRQQALLIERICALGNATPSTLAGSSRQLYCWLKFLCSDGSLALHLAALVLAREAIAASQAAVKKSTEVHLSQISSLWRVRRYANHVLLVVSEGFAAGDSTVWDAILRNCLDRREPTSGLLIREFSESEDFSELITSIESFAEPPSASAQGRVHDLHDSFERVNRRYFAGRMPMPKLTWSRSLSTTKLGHYRSSADTVMVAASLDERRVPVVVIDLVMYHELLHKRHGAITVNGRRLVHTAQFRADERRFAGYEEVKRQLNELAHAPQSAAKRPRSI